MPYSADTRLNLRECAWDLSGIGSAGQQAQVKADFISALSRMSQVNLGNPETNSLNISSISLEMSTTVEDPKNRWLLSAVIPPLIFKRDPVTTTVSLTYTLAGERGRPERTRIVPETTIVGTFRGWFFARIIAREKAVAREQAMVPGIAATMMMQDLRSTGDYTPPPPRQQARAPRNTKPRPTPVQHTASKPAPQQTTSTPPVNLPPRNFPRRNIAVMDLESPVFSAAEVTILSENLRSTIVDSDYFTVVSRADMKRILEEQKFQKTDLVDTQTLARMGKILGVEKIVGGVIGRVSDTFSLTIRLVDVATAKVDVSHVLDVTGREDALLKEVRNLGRQMCQKYADSRITAP
jgi:hypothetical protein